VDYRWEITFANGEIYNSPAYQFDYLDNRFAWNFWKKSLSASTGTKVM